MTLHNRPLYQQISIAICALENCLKKDNLDWACHWEQRLAEMESRLPSGGGFDSGTKINFDKSTPEKLVFDTAFHHMNENGFYCGWTEHAVTVRPSLQFGFEVKVGGRNKNDIKDYIHEVFSTTLEEV